MTALRSAVIGLGNIGMGYDYDRARDGCVLTHASAFSRHTGFDLVGAVDTDPKKRKAFEKKYRRRAYSTIGELMNSADPQVVSIAVPTAVHCRAFMETVAFGPKAIICEKPIAENSAQARRMLCKAKVAHSAVLVNYMRRFEPGVNELKKMIQSSRYGEIYKGTVWYSKGILHNGSHFIDLMRYLLGEVTLIQLIDPGRKWLGCDPEPDVAITFGRAEIVFLSGREEHFSLAEIELVGTKGKIRYGREGNLIESFNFLPDRTFPGYRVLSEKPEIIRSDLKCAQLYVLDNLLAYLKGETKALLSSGATALGTLVAVEKIIKKRNVIAK
jgi:predicted dehydrogenase